MSAASGGAARLPPGGGPVVDVVPVALRPAAPGHWLVTWRLANQGDQPLVVLAAWQPHGRFRAAQCAFDPPLRLAPGEQVTVELAVASSGEPGEVVENGFLILRALWGDAPWRVLARLTLTYGADGAPAIAREAITTQPIGFSQ